MTQKIAICAPSHNFVGLYLRNEGTYRQSEKNLLSSSMSSTCFHNMVNFGLLAAEIGLPVWGTAPNFNGLRVLATLLHSSSERQPNFAAAYVRQGDHHVGHWPTFLVTVARDRDIDSERLLYFGRVIFLFLFFYFFPSTKFLPSLGRFSRNFTTRRGMC